jgi:DNA-binding XRE family transcriptional regulator
MTSETKRNLITEGEVDYQEWRDGILADPTRRARYDEELAKSELWLQLVEARHDAGLTQQELAKKLGVSQAQVARLERRGYDAYTLSSLRRYVEALGGDFQLQVSINRVDGHGEPTPAAHQ